MPSKELRAKLVVHGPERRQQRELVDVAASIRDARAHLLEQRPERRLDWDGAHRAWRLRELHLSGARVDGLADVHDASLEVDVSVRERLKFLRANVRVRGDGVDLAPFARNVRAREQLRELTRVDERRAARAPSKSITFASAVEFAAGFGAPAAASGFSFSLSDSTFRSAT